MRYKDFEIWPTTFLDGHTEPNRYDVVKWYKTDVPIEVTNLETGQKSMNDTFCFSVAQIYWNPKEPCWKFESVGMRFIEEYEEGLCEYIKKYMELVDVCRGEDDDRP